jgi:hypothetical protein
MSRRRSSSNTSPTCNCSDCYETNAIANDESIDEPVNEPTLTNVANGHNPSAQIGRGKDSLNPWERMIE